MYSIVVFVSLVVDFFELQEGMVKVACDGIAALLRKIVRRRACALERAWRSLRYKDIDHNLRTEHEYILPNTPRTMSSMVVFT
jgi:hypothetical protein